MGNRWTWKQIFAFFLIFFPPFVFYALQKKAFVRSTETFLGTPAHRLQKFYDNLTHKIRSSFKDYLYLVETNEENRDLKLKITKMTSELHLLEEDRMENIRLHKLFRFQQKLPQKTLAARVISKDILLDQESFIIDKGSAHGVQRLQGVISAQGVVGYTLDVKTHSSQVLLLSSQDAHIDAIIQRTQARGLISGLSPKVCQFNYMMRENDARKGDKVVTSGRHGFFPKGFPIGTVKNVKSSSTGVSYLAQVEPLVKVNRLENVLVIINREPTQTDADKAHTKTETDEDTEE